MQLLTNNDENSRLHYGGLLWVVKGILALAMFGGGLIKVRDREQTQTINLSFMFAMSPLGVVHR